MLLYILRVFYFPATTCTQRSHQHALTSCAHRDMTYMQKKINMHARSNRGGRRGGPLVVQKKQNTLRWCSAENSPLLRGVFEGPLRKRTARSPLRSFAQAEGFIFHHTSQVLLHAPRPGESAGKSTFHQPKHRGRAAKCVCTSKRIRFPSFAPPQQLSRLRASKRTSGCLLPGCLVQGQAPEKGKKPGNMYKTYFFRK